MFPTPSSAASEPSSQQVLSWVMSNTCKAMQDGVLEWTKQGLFHAGCLEQPERVMQDEVLAPQDMYAPGIKREGVDRIAAAMTERAIQEAKPQAKALSLMREICANSSRYGEGHLVLTGLTADEECEREMEQEEEEEEEREVQVAKVEPAAENDWVWTMAARSPLELPSAAGVMPLKRLTEKLQPESLRSIKWSESILITRNFMMTVLDNSEGAFLRPIQSLVVFPNEQVLLISEREADVLLEQLYKQQTIAQLPANAGQVPVLVTRGYAAAAASHQSGPPQLPMLALGVKLPLGPLSPSGKALMPMDALVSLQLLNGETVYRLRQHRELLHGLMRRNLEGAESLVSLRGRESLLPKSQLQEACNDVLHS